MSDPDPHHQGHAHPAAAVGPRAAADEVADATRRLNHTLTGTRWLTVADLYGIVGSLDQAATRIQNTLGVLAAGVDAHRTIGGHRHDHHADPATELADARAHLERSVAYTAAISSFLGQAQAGLGHLTEPNPSRPEPGPSTARVR